MDTQYNPSDFEQKRYMEWEQKGYFAPQGEGESYCIMIPPPNVTGSLHMGHGFQLALQDALIRYHRMRGAKTLWQVGTDHAGIATQMLVERQLPEGTTRHDLGRDAFIEKVWQWKETSGGFITKQMRELGASVDWQRERFTMDEGLSQTVTEIFVRLYEEGLIYRGKRLVNWDPTLLTAISDLEVLSEEENGKMWHIRYPLAASDEHLVVATTRPETMLGDAAVAVHPDDARYKHLVGKMICLPLCDREIPIIADEYVDPEFGTGCVKITPAHDFNDYAVGLRHDLPLLNIFTPSAEVLGEDWLPQQYHGLDRNEARKQIVVDLQKNNFLEKIEDHVLKVPRGDRSGDVIEPYLTDQWYVKTKPLADKAMGVVRSGELAFHPENWQKTYFQWLENIEDWCISRQLWWGHRVPAWYDDSGKVYVGRDEASVREANQLGPEVILHQDEDVLDTWFSSAFWPFATLDWPQDTEAYKTFYPTNVLVTGFDIIFFWVARMVMMGLKFCGDVPFKDVYITGLIRDAEGQKMSKSKGNVLDPLDIVHGIERDALIEKNTKRLMQPHLREKIEKYTKAQYPNGIPACGTDALRFTFCALATHNRDINFDIARVEANRNFCNKIWNAARYVLMNTEGQPLGSSSSDRKLSLADRWMTSKLQVLIESLHENFSTYRFDFIAQSLYEFFWHDFCDWYLELSKPVLTLDSYSEEEKAGTRHTLLTSLEVLLRLMHPVMPFISEEIWLKVKSVLSLPEDTLVLAAYPEVDSGLRDESVMMEMQWVQKFITGIRTVRSEMDVSPKQALELLVTSGDANDHSWLKNNEVWLKHLAKLQSIRKLEADESPPPAATALVGEMELLIPLAGLIDVEEEKKRLLRAEEKLLKECQKLESRLNNESFVKRAPEAVVNKERQQLEANQLQLAKYREKLDTLGKLS